MSSPKIIEIGNSRGGEAVFEFDLRLTNSAVKIPRRSLHALLERKLRKTRSLKAWQLCSMVVQNRGNELFFRISACRHVPTGRLDNIWLAFSRMFASILDPRPNLIRGEWVNAENRYMIFADIRFIHDSYNEACTTSFKYCQSLVERPSLVLVSSNTIPLTASTVPSTANETSHDH